MKKIASFSDLLKQSWQVVKKHRLLWLFGLFSLFGTSIFSFVSYSNDQGVENSEALKNIFLSQWQGFSTIEIILTVIACAVFSLLSYWSLASLFYYLNKLKAGTENLTLKQVLIANWKKMFSLLLIDILFSLPIAIAGLILFLVVMFVTNIAGWIIVGILFIFIIVYLLLMNLFKKFAYCESVMENKKVFASIFGGWKIMINSFGTTIVAKLMELLFWLVASLAMIAVMIVAVIGFVLIYFITSLLIKSIILGTILGIVIVIVVLLFYIFAFSVVNACISAYIANVYWKLKEARR